MKSSGEDGASVTVVAGVVGLDADIVEFGVEKPFPEPHGACPHTHSDDGRITLCRALPTAALDVDQLCSQLEHFLPGDSLLRV